MTPLAWWLVALVDAAAIHSKPAFAAYEWLGSNQRRQWLAACPRGLA